VNTEDRSDPFADADSGGIPPWHEYRKPGIFTNLSNINGFAILIELPKAARWVATPSAQRVAAKVYDEVRGVLEAAEFYEIQHLDLVVSDEKIGVRYRDDEYAFSVLFDSDGDLAIRREGSSFERFHEWYVRFMPSLRGLVDRLLQAVSEEVYAEVGRELKQIRAQYTFEIIAYDLKKPAVDGIERNTSVLKKLLNSMPDQDGHIREDLESDELGRVDVSVNRWDTTGQSPVREIYRVEAPANRRYTSLWFSFVYVGETWASRDNVRGPFDPTTFLSEYEPPYVNFLRGKALLNFVAELTDGYEFQTTAGRLP